MVKVSDVMTRDIASVAHNASIVDAANAMLKNGVSSVVVKKGEETVGIITDKDFVRLASFGGNPRGVTSNMNTGLISIGHDADLLDAFKLMKEKDVRHLFVKEKGSIVGIISSKDIFRGMADMPSV
ncbi:MAG: CBS domain-containing protein [Candidatus Hydrothermarchaeaceae archaeon]